MADFLSPSATKPPSAAPEMAVSLDMVRRGLMIAPLFLLGSGAIWGLRGVAGAGYGLTLILINFLIAAAIIKYSSAISLGLLMGAVMFGYLFRLGFLFAAVVPVHKASWISLPALCVTMLFTHLGLLIWEIRYVSISLAFPGLKPPKQSSN